MTDNYFEIKDKCRKGLLKYLSDALKIIPPLEKPDILDIGCGTGVATLCLAENFNGIITAIDSDIKPLAWLQKKVKILNLGNRIITVNRSFFDVKFDDNSFDIILAEGFLNIVGFHKGFMEIIKILRINRFLVVHDEYKEHKSKCEFITDCNCKICGSFVLDELVWWNDYYKLLEEEIYLQQNKGIAGFFRPDLDEIKLFRLIPNQFRSVYYIIQKL